MKALALILLLVSLSLAQEVQVFVIVKGKVEKLYVKEGQTVKKGQKLLKIDPSLYLAEKKRLEGKKKEIEARLWKVERDYMRLKELFERDLLAETRLENQKIQYDTLKAQIQQVEGELDRIETLISYTEITAPVGGRIKRIFVYEGSFVNGSLTPQVVILISR